MASTKDAVQFYWDPVCPWCWITSRWMEDVGRQKAIDVRTGGFLVYARSTKVGPPERFRVSHLMGLRALRVAAAVREQHGLEAVRKLYTVMGTRKHHDQADIGTVAELESILRTCGLPTDLAAAADDETWDKVIEADMASAVAKAGKDVGVPLIVLDGGMAQGFLVLCSVLLPRESGGGTVGRHGDGWAC